MKLKCVLIFFSGMAISMMAMSFFNMPQKMFEMGSQMVLVIKIVSPGTL